MMVVTALDQKSKPRVAKQEGKKENNNHTTYKRKQPAPMAKRGSNSHDRDMSMIAEQCTTNRPKSKKLHSTG
jgi:hypothetical protein